MVPSTLFGTWLILTVLRIKSKMALKPTFIIHYEVAMDAKANNTTINPVGIPGNLKHNLRPTLRLVRESEVDWVQPLAVYPVSWEKLEFLASQKDADNIPTSYLVHLVILVTLERSARHFLNVHTFRCSCHKLLCPVFCAHLKFTGFSDTLYMGGVSSPSGFIFCIEALSAVF